MSTMESSETDKLLQHQHGQTTNERDDHATTNIIYTRRWVIILVFASLGCMQSAMCVVWLVVAESTEAAFGWSNSDLTVMQIWIYAMYIIGMPLFAWFMQNKGMRVSTIIAAVFIFLSTICRMISSSPPYVTIFAHLGHIFNGLSSPVLFAGQPIISQTWFPANQRTTATAIMAEFALSGTALIFIIDPYVVPSPILQLNNTTLTVAANIDEIRSALMKLRYIEFGIAFLLLILTAVYFPANPPTAPSTSATVEKTSYRKAISQIFSRDKLNVWFVAIPYAVDAGLFGVFASMLDVILKDVAISQTTVGWLIFSGTVFSSFAGVAIGQLGDRCVGRRKTMLLIMTILASLASLILTLIINNYIPFNIVGIFIAYITMGAGVQGAMALFYEACIETTFPISEGVTMGIITTMYNIFPIAFLIVPLIPNIGTMWMNWFMFGGLVLCLPLLGIYQERYDRLSLDNPVMRKSKVKI